MHYLGKMTMTDATPQGHGLKSLDAALGVLAFLGQQSGSMSLTEIARGCGMAPSKVHRYLASFVDASLVKQEGRSGQYDLGPGALQLGLSAIARHDFVNSTADGMADLARETGMTALLAVWGNDGATVVRWERGTSPIVTSMGLGTTLPLLNSATGRAFLAWAPRPAVQKSLDSELRRATRNPAIVMDIHPSMTGILELVSKIKNDGFATVDGRFIPGLIAASAPILDWQDEAQAVITLVGVDPLRVQSGTPEITALLKFCAKYSVRSDQP
ncbi:MAG: DNA-binding IclR family transcriptional regulator [Celeribacter sp.]|jgi:DNA-binding IclR family transcriptional regulator